MPHFRSSSAPAWLPLLLLLLALPSAAAAPRYHTYVYGPRDGLVSGFIYDVEQDPAGRLWLATRHGLLGYDGLAWTAFDNARYDVVGGPRFLEIDAEGRLWSVTAIAPPRVMCHTTAGERVRELDPGFERTDHGPVAFALDHPDGAPPRLALATGDNELALWDGDAWRRHDLDDRLDWISVLLWHDGAVLAGSDTGLWRVPPDGAPVRITPPGLPDGPVDALAAARDGGVWVVGDDWVGRLDDGRVEVLARGLDGRLANARHGALAQEGPCGGLYYGDHGLVFYFDPVLGEVEPLDRAAGLVSSGVTDLEMDREGTVWAASYRGLTKILGRALAGYDRRNGLLEDEVSAVLERRDGTFVLGHAGGVTFLGDSVAALSYADQNPFVRVMDLSEDPAGDLWIAADRAGLARWTPRRGFEWFRVTDDHDDIVYSQTFAPDGTHWIGHRHGLYRREGTGFVEVDLDPRISTFDTFIRRLQFDRAGRLLVCTGRLGLYRAEGDGFARFVAEGDDATLADRVFCAWEAPDGRLWAGTSAGLREAVDGRLVRTAAPDPEIDLPVYAILQDAAGRVWYGTERGVLRWDGTRMTSLHMGDGLLGNEVNRDALVLDSRGRVWIGTEGGVSRYDARFDVPPLAPPQVELVGVEIDGALSPLDGPLDMGVGPRDLVIHYAGLSYLDETQLRFRTRLEGASGGWTPAHVSPLRQERFLNVPHGTYRFHLQAVGANGRVSEVVVSPPLTFRPHLWQRGWVRVLAALAALLVLWILITAAAGRRYTRRLRREVDARTRDLAASEALLRRESDRLGAVLEHISDGVMTLDADRVVTLCNPGCERLAGRSIEEIHGRPLADVLPEVDAWLRADPVDALRISPETAVRTPDGRDLWLELAATPMSGPEAYGGRVLVLRDVTRRRRDLHERVRAQRLESLGVLAGGIAHDFNNLLMAIIGNASLIAEEGGLNGAGRESIRGVLTAGQRAQQLTGNLLTFARGGSPLRRSVALEGLVRDAVALAMSGTSVRTEIDLPADLPNVLGDPAQIGQVVSNLLINARQAMPDGGVVRVSARRVDGPLEGLEGDLFVRLRLSDDGPGIAPDLIERVFEPYFSTKEAGSGLGLSIVYSVVQRHGGAIRVSSPPGSGAEFEIDLPATRLSEAEARREREAARPPVSRVLVLDDEAAVREVIRRHLIGAGVAVVSAPAGEEAVEIFRHEAEAGRGFDAVLLDLTVRGGMGGLEAFGHMRALDPDVVGVVTSGYPDEPAMSDPAAHGFAAALVKPFEREELMGALERASRSA